MCGIVGYIDLSNRIAGEELTVIAERMANCLFRRGPDDGGAWADESSGVALGHRRLSIIDLSPQGHQPMISHCGRYVIVLNGEIYNFHEIRKELDGQSEPVRWRGHSDTEVLLEAVARWGVEETLRRTVGMFAFAIWDKRDRFLTLARDRMGEKPLYYGWMNKVFLFGSELKAMRQHPCWNGDIDRNALTLLMRHNCIPAPYSIYQGISKLPPGSFLTLKLGHQREVPEIRVVRYWSARNVAEHGVRTPFKGDEEEAIEHLDRLLRRSVGQQMLSDVPLGAFLSGGVDSSTIVAMMQAQSGRPVKTFTIGFREAGYNEAEHAAAVARHLGTDHTELYVTSAEAMAVIPELPTLYDEPFSDSSQIPTYLVAKLARRHVTVSLSGDAGDELFGGYHRYFLGRRLWKSVGWIPKTFRKGMARGIRTLPVRHWDVLATAVRPLLSSRARHFNVGDKLHKLAEILAVNSPEVMYRELVSHWKQPASLVLGASEPSTILTDKGQWADVTDFTERMMYLDAVTYLPDDILVKVDRACMGVSLESRVPLLDHRVIEFAWSLPLSMKVKNGQGKWLLRKLLDRYVPRHLIERPKMGFGIPVFSWLRGPLREWAEELLHPARLRQEGYLDDQQITQMWQDHKSCRRNWQYHLWDVLMFQSWLDHQ